jgi:ATP-dependent Lhr-like helicase
VAGLGAAQFALPGAVDLLRSLRDPARADRPDEVVRLAATDPANPYGATLKFPAAGGRAPMRTVGSTVILVNGAIAAFLQRGDRMLLTWLPENEPERSRTGRAVARALIDRARGPAPSVERDPDAEESPRGMLIEEVDGLPAAAHPLAPFLVDAGFRPGALGLRATF